MTDIWLLYSTFPSRKEALSTAQALLKKRLIACANLYDQVTSLYRWQGSLQQETEVVVIAKTRKEKVAAAIAAIKGAHSYALPCVAAWPAGGGYAPFMKWVGEEVKGQKSKGKKKRS